MGPTNLSRSALVQEDTEPCPEPCSTRAHPPPLPDRCCSSSPATTRSNAVPGRDLAMSSSASASRRSWPRYGAVPMTRCPACPRIAPLKRLVTTTDKNGNLGREFVKCESKPEQGKVRFYFSICQFWFLSPNFIFAHFSLDLGFRVHLSDFRN